jgi:hypothetical protein
MRRTRERVFCHRQVKGQANTERPEHGTCLVKDTRVKNASPRLRGDLIDRPRRIDTERAKQRLNGRIPLPTTSKTRYANRAQSFGWALHPSHPSLLHGMVLPVQRSSQRKKKSRRHTSRNRNLVAEKETGSSEDEDHSSSSSSYDYRRWTRRRAQLLEDERSRLIAQWKSEARAETVASRRHQEAEQWHSRVGRYLDFELGGGIGQLYMALSWLEAFICNLPLTVGAISMAIVTLGVVWFKFVEESLESCEPVQFHSSQCTFPEFPGCFYCDTADPYYRVAVNFHLMCSAFAGMLALSLFLKLLMAPQAFFDELSSPTTASPAGLVTMTIVCVFAGRGIVGQIFVSVASCLHVCLVIWFIYMVRKVKRVVKMNHCLCFHSTLTITLSTHAGPGLPHNARPIVVPKHRRDRHVSCQVLAVLSHVWSFPDGHILVVELLFLSNKPDSRYVVYTEWSFHIKMVVSRY